MNILRSLRISKPSPSAGRRPVLRGRALLNEAEVGPKFARQARMAAAGLPVPRFFCLSAAVFTQVLSPVRADVDAVLVDVDAGDSEALEKKASILREMVLRAPVPAAAERQLYEAFDQEFGPGAVVSVRSSVVGSGAQAGEDSAHDAFAGISDSFLYVTRDQLLDKVRQCWASAFGPQALLYRAARGGTQHGFEVAVGVQRMEFGRRSFVLFTCDPLTGARDRVLAAGLGIGEGVVQEKVPVDHYFISRRDDAVRSVLAHKTQLMEENPERLADGPRTAPVPEELCDTAVLTEEQIRKVVATGDRIERLFGCPQDIEGTFTADGTLHILQARPVVLELDRQRLWSNANITESYPDVTTALTYSFAQRFYREDFHDFYRRLGVRRTVLDRHEGELRGMIGLLRGRVYYSLSVWYTLHGLSRTFPLWRGSFERMMGMSPSVTHVRPTPPLTCPGKLPATSAALVRLAVSLLTHGAAARNFEAWWQRTLAEHRTAATTADPLQLVQLMRSLWREAGSRWGITLVNDILLQMHETLAMRLFERWLPQADPGLHSDLLCGGEENRSVVILMSVIDIAERVRGIPAVLDALAVKTAEEVWEEVDDGAYGADLADRLRTHVELHGDRGLQELKLEVLLPRDQPSQLLRTAAEYARGDLTRQLLRTREAEARRAGEHRLAGLLTGHPLRRRVLRAVVAAQRRHINIRENTRYNRSELFGFARHVYHRLGADLAARGLLESAQDVVHLTEEEILGTYDGTAVTDDLRGLAALRRAEYHARGAELPMDFVTMGPVRDGLPDPNRGTAAEGTLHGLGSSGGVVRGTARVVVDPHQLGEPTDDMILVARETDPGWLFLMLSARGIVVERGTLLSHTAISGRKFGIPTIVALQHATTRIPDGARVEMDGAAGTVTILEEDEA
ncbi:PEP/pyruvate-binding domain-containing protein [Streptomyces nigrescens]|uniref:PEP/pyruvate-binding domain-containing protein n=1 Tax=Streptomyces nigrescens TaxID=1920 RepID=UPI00224EE0C4|nr:PEP/pyruvate-binding domain-containing protein [Streptomyces libani]MCX5449464.1 PEP-utilizing enzyme [Streptomyces libani]